MSAGRFLRKENGVEQSSIGLANSLKKLEFPIDRLRTGTPPRLDGSTINYEGLEIQDSDEDIQFFSFVHEFNEMKPVNPLIKCFITQTNEKAH